MDEELDDLLTEVDQFVRSLPVEEAVCECHHLGKEHTRVGQREIWTCKGDSWKCPCSKFVPLKVTNEQ